MTMSKRKVTIIMRENRGTTSNTKEDRAGEGRQGHVELREHPGLGGAAAGGAGLGGPLRGLVRSAGARQTPSARSRGAGCGKL